MNRIHIIPALLLAIGLFLSACSRSSDATSAVPNTATPSPSPTLSPTPVPPTPTPLPTLTPLPGARIEEAELAFRMGDYLSARSAFETALANSTDSDIQAAGLIGLGRLYAQQGDTYNALLNLRAVEERYPDSPNRPEADFYMAQVYETLNRPLDAAEAYQSYLARQPGVLDAYVHERLGDIFSTVGDPQAALQEYLSAYASPRLPDNLSLTMKIARMYARTGDHATALVMYEDLISRSNSDFTRAELTYLTGMSYRFMGMEDEALQAFTQAVDNYPTAYDSYLALVELVDAGISVDELQRGIIDYYAGQYTVGLAALDRYLADNPPDAARAQYYRGMSLYALSEFDDAMSALTEVVNDYPATSHWARACDELAFIQWAELGFYQEASQTLVDCVDAVPYEVRAAEFLYTAARIAERDDDLGEAAMLWERTADDFPQSEYAFRGLFNAGIAHFRLGSYTEAQAVFLRAYEGADSPGSQSAALMWAGKTFVALNNTDSAASLWEQAAAIDPTGYYSERARELISGRSPFGEPAGFDLGSDHAGEQAQAEAWLRRTFDIQGGGNLRDLAELYTDPGMQRGLAFWQLGLYDEATAEFDNLRLVYQNDPLVMYRLAIAFTDLRAYRHAILSARQVLTLAGMDDAATLNAPRFFNRIRFATPFSEVVIQVAADYGLHPLLIWSIMRQESFFDTGIASTAGARGLMQIMPETGQDIARRMAWPTGYTTEDLNRPIINIRMGVDYLADMRTYLEYDLYAALAAYNGGPGNALIWKEMGGGDPDLLLEVIRLSEPAHYIRGIYEMYGIYRRLYERAP